MPGRSTPIRPSPGASPRWWPRPTSPSTGPRADRGVPSPPSSAIRSLPPSGSRVASSSLRSSSPSFPPSSSHSGSPTATRPSMPVRPMRSARPTSTRTSRSTTSRHRPLSSPPRSRSTTSGSSFTAFAAGILLCVGTAYILLLNGSNVGYVAGWFAVAGAQPFFYGLILPHGLLELSAVVIAGASGLRLGWAVIAPGDRTRGQSVAEEGKRAVVIVLGLVLAFIVAGAIEGFVTGSSAAHAGSRRHRRLGRAGLRELHRRARSARPRRRAGPARWASDLRLLT